MKVLLAILALSSSTYAGQENHGISGFDPEAIYKALNVTAEPQTPGYNSKYRLVKSAGGLFCDEQVMLGSRVPVYSCNLDIAKEDFKELYNALDVTPEVLTPEDGAALQTRKSVGGLTCIAAQVFNPEETTQYHCEMSG